MVSEKSSVAPERLAEASAADAVATGEGEAAIDSSTSMEDAFFRRGDEEDQAARKHMRQKLAAMPRWPGLGWAILLLITSTIAAAVLLLAFPPAR